MLWSNSLVRALSKAILDDKLQSVLGSIEDCYECRESTSRYISKEIIWKFYGVGGLSSSVKQEIPMILAILLINLNLAHDRQN